MRREREDSIIYAWPKTDEFLRAAIEDGAVIRTLKNVEEAQLGKAVRDMNIMGIYFASPGTYGDIAEIYSFRSRQRVGQITKGSMTVLWSNCSQEIQERFPLDEIKIGKPFGRRTWERMSNARSGLACHVAELLEKGVALEEIKMKLGLSGDEIGRLRKILEKWGVELPYINTRPSENKKLAKVLQTANSDLEIQEALDRLGLAFYQRHGRGENPILTPVSKIANTLNFRSRLKKASFFAEKLIAAGIPVGHIQRTVKSGRQAGGILNYYFIVSRYLERAQKVLSGFLL